MLSRGPPMGSEVRAALYAVLTHNNQHPRSNVARRTRRFPENFVHLFIFWTEGHFFIQKDK